MVLSDGTIRHIAVELYTKNLIHKVDYGVEYVLKAILSKYVDEKKEV